METIYEVKQNLKKLLKKNFNNQEIYTLTKIIFEDILGIPATQLAISDTQNLPTPHAKQLYNAANELNTGKPVQYVTGKSFFFDSIFQVSSAVLIPRPETEELVNYIVGQNQKKHLTILDIGTGSGCIAITLSRVLKTKVDAVDISEQALEIAKQNAKKLGAEINFTKIDILNYKGELKNKKFDIIVSNPPYVTENEKVEMQKNVLKFEPELALFVPNNKALKFYEAITKLAVLLLKPQGKLYFEINETKGIEVIELLKNNNFKNCKILPDFNDKNRFVYAKNFQEII